MSSQNLISATLAEETQAEILQALAEIKGKLNFLITLQPEEIRTLIKAGNGFAPLIEKAFLVANEHPEILPPVVDIDEFKKDYALIRALTIITNQVDELADGLKNTLIAAKSDAMVGTLEIYTAVRQHRIIIPTYGASEGGEIFLILFEIFRGRKLPFERVGETNRFRLAMNRRVFENYYFMMESYHLVFRTKG